MEARQGYGVNMQISWSLSAGAALSGWMADSSSEFCIAAQLPLYRYLHLMLKCGTLDREKIFCHIEYFATL